MYNFYAKCFFDFYLFGQTYKFSGGGERDQNYFPNWITENKPVKNHSCYECVFIPSPHPKSLKKTFSLRERIISNAKPLQRHEYCRNLRVKRNTDWSYNTKRKH